MSDDAPEAGPIVAVEPAGADHVARITLSRPPHNYFSLDMIAAVADALEALDEHDDCRAVVLCAEGKNFCAGADFSGAATYTSEQLYAAAVRLFRTRKPIVAAVQGAAIGGGLGLALAADFRVAAPEARFSANFTRLGFHPGFGLTATLPRLVGQQKAQMIFYTGRRYTGEEAVTMGLADQLAPLSELRSTAMALAAEIAVAAPLALQSTRETLRRGLADAIETATERELVEQEWQRRTADFREGVKAMAERRTPDFKGR